MSWPLWKQTEKRIAERLNGHRLGVTGTSTPDVVDSTGYLVIEVKHRAKLPRWLLDGMVQAELYADEPDQTPVLILHEKHMVIDDSLVILRLDDFLRLWR